LQRKQKNWERLKIISKKRRKTGETLAVYQEIRQELQEKEKEYRGACLAAERYQEEINQNLENFRQLLLKIGRCPVCYGKLDQKAVERALDEYR